MFALYVRTHLWRRNLAETDYVATSAWGSKACLSHEAPDLCQQPDPALGPCRLTTLAKA
jgi:hypothetical protein